MRQGRSLTDLFSELDRQASAKRDFVAPVTSITMEASEPEVIEAEVIEDEPSQRRDVSTALTLRVGDQGNYPIRSLAHEQIATYLNIPRDYYNRLRLAYPHLLVADVNAWLHDKRDRKNNVDRRMIRTLDGQVRANLSDQYRPIENFDLAEVILTEAQTFGGDLKLASADVTETKLYLKFIYPVKRGEIKVGDIVEAGSIVRNSEVGMGKIEVEPYVHRLACLNGMILPVGGLKKSHVGKAWAELDEAYEVFSDETRKADDRALFLKVRDVFRSALTGDLFDKQVKLLQAAQGSEITGSVEAATTVVAKRYGLNETERSAVLRNLITGGDISQYGLAQAVTAVANTHPSYDRATEIEAIGGQVIVLPQHDWKEIATAKPADAKRALAA